jgi:hypothetical protein
MMAGRWLIWVLLLWGATGQVSLPPAAPSLPSTDRSHERRITAFPLSEMPAALEESPGERASVIAASSAKSSTEFSVSSLPGFGVRLDQTPHSIPLGFRTVAVSAGLSRRHEFAPRAPPHVLFL